MKCQNTPGTWAWSEQCPCAMSYIPVETLGNLPNLQGFREMSTACMAGKTDRNNPQGLLRDCFSEHAHRRLEVPRTKAL